MDYIITFKEVTEFLKNPPSLASRPDFARIRALCKHLVAALKQLVCPQSAIHGWSGIVMNPVMYTLLEPTPFGVIIDPGPFAMYANFAMEAAIKMANKIFNQNKNYFLLSVNINRACFKSLNDNIADQFKVSNQPSMTG
jgi:hypothetical protein